MLVLNLKIKWERMERKNHKSNIVKKNVRKASISNHTISFNIQIGQIFIWCLNNNNNIWILKQNFPQSLSPSCSTKIDELGRGQMGWRKKSRGSVMRWLTTNPLYELYHRVLLLRMRRSFCAQRPCGTRNVQINGNLRGAQQRESR